MGQMALKVFFCVSLIGLTPSDPIGPLKWGFWGSRMQINNHFGLFSLGTEAQWSQNKVSH